MEINERITQVVKSVYGSQSNAARALGVDRQRMNSIVNGVKPGLDFINLLCDKTENLNMHWLIRGEGSMFLKKPEEIKLPENSPVNNYGGFDITLNRILSLWEDERAQWNITKKEYVERIEELKKEKDQLKQWYEKDATESLYGQKGQLKSISKTILNKAGLSTREINSA
jgi:hypothetical protein